MEAQHAAPLHQVLARARRELVASGSPPDEAAIDVDLFARAILGWDRARLITEQTAPAPAGLEPHFSDFVARRKQREPSAYIVSTREFWSLEFRVTPAVLIPRPETELVVEEALRLLKEEPAANRAGAAGRPARVADVGTGSGCIVVSIAHDAPDCRFVATDVSTRALDVARGNAVRHGVADRIAFVATSYLDGVGRDFDLITANPPYVRDGDKRALAPDVRHEPDVALFGGASGLRHIEGVLDTSARRLRAGGWLVMEFGFGQEEDVRALVASRPRLRMDHVLEDLQGLARTAVIQRAGV